MTDKDFKKMLDREIMDAENALINLCINLGESSLKLALDKSRYVNRKGVLRSSTGYCVVSNGNIVKVGGFKAILQGSEGVIAGRALAEEMAKEIKGIGLCLVAGAKHAIYVNAKGFDVMDSAELFIESTAPKLLKDLGYIVR